MGVCVECGTPLLGDEAKFSYCLKCLKASEERACRNCGKSGRAAFVDSKSGLCIDCGLKQNAKKPFRSWG